MKTRDSNLLRAVAAAGALIASSAASGAYTGLTTQLHEVVIINGTARSVWRVYANFTHGANDLLFGWSGPTTDTIHIQSLNASGTGLGGNFFNPGGGSAGSTAPTLEQINGGSKTPATPNIQWGTFATIGVPIADLGSGPTPRFPDVDQTELSPGFPNFISGNSITFAGACFAVPQGTTGQGSAGYAADGDSQFRVLMMQLTVNYPDHVGGEVDVQVQLGGSGVTVTFEDQIIGVLTPPQPCLGDNVPPFGLVNVDDLLGVINGWGMCPPPPPASCPADVSPLFSGDGVVNVDDLIMVITGWGTCPHSGP